MDPRGACGAGPPGGRKPPWGGPAAVQARRPLPNDRANYFCAAAQILSVVAPTGFFVMTGSLLPFISVSTVRS